eukprot:169775-Rhodomonas_salina.1
MSAHIDDTLILCEDLWTVEKFKALMLARLEGDPGSPCAHAPPVSDSVHSEGPGVPQDDRHQSG